MRNRRRAGWPRSNVGGLSYRAPCEEGTMSTRTDLEEWAAARVHGICLKTGPPRKVGVELEWLVRDVRDPALPVSADRVAAAVAGFNAVPDLDAATSFASRLRLPSSDTP